MFANIFASIVIWGIALVCVFQILMESGCLSRKGNFCQILHRKKTKFPACAPTKFDFLKIFVFAGVFRVACFLLSYLVLYLFNANDGSYPIENTINEWLKWDANNYIRIATLDYDGYIETNGMYSTLVFFPLYSWIIRFFLLFFQNPGTAALIAASLCYMLGCCYLFGFVSLEYGKRIAWKSVLLISIFPFSFFLGAMMPESTFLFVASACLYYTKKHKWPLVALFGILAALSRMQGVLLFVPAFLEWMIAYKPFRMIQKKQWKLFRSVCFSKLMWLPLIGIGTLIYLWENYRVTGDAFYFLKCQEAIWNQHAQYFGKTIENLWTYAMTDHVQDFSKVAIWIPQLVIFIFACVVLVYGVRRHKPQYTCFLLLYTVMNYTPSWLLSAGRYMTVAIPMYFILAEWLDKKPKLWSAILVIFSMLFSVYMWGFLQWRQIF